MAFLSMIGTGNAEEIANLLQENIPNCGVSCELVENFKRKVSEEYVYVMVFEKYYIRNSSRASLTVVVTNDQDKIIVDAIGSGGGQGWLYSFSWGAEDNFVNTVMDLLIDYGFSERE